MDGLDRRILRIADGSIKGMLKARSADFLSSFAVPLPVAVISELLGIPPEEREQVHEWASDMMTKDGVPKPEGTMRQYRAILAMEGCIRRAIAEKKSEAKYLKTLPPGTTLDGNALAFTVLPYFSDNPFTRYEMERYRKHGQYPADESVAQMIGYAPDTIVLRGTETGTAAGRPRNRPGGCRLPSNSRFLWRHVFSGSKAEAALAYCVRPAWNPLGWVQFRNHPRSFRGAVR